MANWLASHAVKSALPSQPAALTRTGYRFAGTYRVSNYGAMLQLVEHKANGQTGLPGTRIPEYDHAACFLLAEIRADFFEHARSTACSELRSELGAEFQIADHHILPAAQLIKKDPFPALNGVGEVIGFADQCRA